MSGECAALSANFREVLVSLDRRLKKISDTAESLSLETFKSDKLTKNKKLVLKEGSPKQDAFAITEGQTHVIRRTAKGHLPLVTLGKGDVFGYVPFMDVGHEPRRASVLASKDLKVDKLDIGSLQKEYDQLPETLRRMIESVTSSISVTTRLACNLHEGN